MHWSKDLSDTSVQIAVEIEAEPNAQIIAGPSGAMGEAPFTDLCILCTVLFQCYVYLLFLHRLSSMDGGQFMRSWKRKMTHANCEAIASNHDATGLAGRIL